jgi:signal transduction histidine kinase
MSTELTPMGRQLHDGVLQSLAIARIRLGQALALNDGPLPRELGLDLKLLLDREIAGLRRLIGGSEPATPPQPDLPSALTATAAHLQSLTGLRIRVENLTARQGRWAGNDLVAYRIMREALHNTAKHSGAKHAWVTVATRRGRLLCTVSDDGHGFTPATADAHFGLSAMYAQARAAGGYLAVQSRPTGTFVTLSVPGDPVPEGEAQR